MANENKIAIVGAGINGLCLAYELVNRGFLVEIFDQFRQDANEARNDIDWQILRTHYIQSQGYSNHIESAVADWRALFSKLGQNFFLPVGIASISRQVGDWSDALAENLSQSGIPFRLLSPEQLGFLYPGFDFGETRFGVVSDTTGIIDAVRLKQRLGHELQRLGVAINYNTQVTSIGDHRLTVGDATHDFDFAIVTASQKKLMPALRWDHQLFTACYCDLIIPREFESFWHYAPAWVDLGSARHQWGIPRVGGGRLRIASGALTVTGQVDAETQKKALLEDYAQIIREFEKYSVGEFHQRRYVGRSDARFQLQIDGSVIGYQGDSGHGFKFAAAHAKLIADAIDSGVYSQACRRVAGLA